MNNQLCYLFYSNKFNLNYPFFIHNSEINAIFMLWEKKTFDRVKSTVKILIEKLVQYSLLKL